MLAMVEGLVLVVAIPAAVTGCGTVSGNSAADVTAVVVADGDNALAPQESPAELDRLGALAADPDRDDVVVDVVAAGTPDVETVDLEPRRPNGQIEYGARRDVLVGARLDALQAAIDRASQRVTDTDILDALALAGRTGASRIVVLSSGLTTTDPLDMRVIGWDRDPTELARDLQSRRLLPDLRGRTVVFSGLARTAGAQPALGLPEQTVLRNQWLAVCSATGAVCQVDDGIRPVRPPMSSLATPVVTVPAETTTSGPDGVTSVTVPAPLLFAPDRCDPLAPGTVMTVLAPVAALLRSGSWTVAVSGRTAPVGPGNGAALATCRADRAADVLRSAFGIPPQQITDVRGDGSRLDPPSASLDARGRLDPTKLAALRRVVFTLTPIKEQ